MGVLIQNTNKIVVLIKCGGDFTAINAESQMVMARPLFIVNNTLKL